MNKNKKTKAITKFKKPRHKNDSSVYIYYNLRYKNMLFVDADNLDEACNKFDECAFANRKDWRIFLEVGSQPN